MKSTYEIDNFNNLQKSPLIFFRYTIQMLTFLVVIYLVHLNFSIVNALLAMVAIIVIEIILEAIAGAKYSKNIFTKTYMKNLFIFIDKYFHYFILLISFGFRMFICYELGKQKIDLEAILFNSICASMVCLFIYLISKELFSKRAGQIVSLMYSLSINVSAYCTVNTTYHIFALLIMMAIYLLTSKKYENVNYIIRSIITTLVLVIASVVRIEGIIYTFAVLVYIFANSLIKDDKQKERRISLVIIAGICVVFVIGIIAYDKIQDSQIRYSKYIDMFKQTEKSIEHFEINSKEYWSSMDYTFISNGLDMSRYKTYDSIIYLASVINAAIIVIYCKIRNIEDERMYLPYLIILINFFVYGFFNAGIVHSYISRIMLFILASGGIAIFKRNAEIEALEKYNVKLLEE